MGHYGQKYEYSGSCGGFGCGHYGSQGLLSGGEGSPKQTFTMDNYGDQSYDEDQGEFYEYSRDGETIESISYNEMEDI